MTKLKTRKQVIKSFMLMHFDTYDYSKVVYKNNRSKVTIVCKTHGPFEQLPNDHKLGVCLHKANGKYKASISINGKRKYLGIYTTIQEASNAYNIAKSEYIIEKANELKDIRVKEALIKNKIKLYDTN